MSALHQLVAEQLFDIECLLRNQGVWSSKPPSPQQLASTMPFAVDTLDFEDWLQFIFMPRMQALINEQAPLPESCAIAPAAEVAFAGRMAERQKLMALLRRFDEILNQAQ